MANRRIFDLVFRTKGLDQAEEGLGDVDNKLQSLGQTAKQTATLLTAALGAAAVGAGTKAVKTAADFEMLRVRLKGLTGSQKEANRLFEEFNQIAARTPFSVQEVIDAGATLEAFGLDAENLLTGIADLAAFMQVDISVAAQNFGRAMNAGAGAADMFRDKGINQLVASFAGVQNVTDLTLPQFQKALQQFIVDPSQPVAGATALMADTLQGKFSNAGDAVDRLAAKFGDRLLPTVKGATDLFIDFVDNVDVERVEAYAKSIGILSASFVAFRLSVIAATNSAKLFKVAIAGTGIGALVVLFGEATVAARKYKDELAGINRETIKMSGVVLQHLGIKKKEAEENQKIVLFQELINAKQTEGLKLRKDDNQGTLELIKGYEEFVATQKQMLAQKNREAELNRLFIIEYPELAEKLGLVTESTDVNNQSLKQSINFSDALANSLQTAFDPNLGAGEAFKGFILQIIQSIQGVIISSGAMAKALTLSFTPLGIGASAAALVALEAAKAGVRSIKFAQFGIDQMVSQPTLIMAGEAGPERVQVTPATRPGASQSNGGMTINFNGPITSKEFVRDTIIPEIRNVQKLGLA